MPNCSSLLSHTHIKAGRSHSTLSLWKRNFPIPDSCGFFISKRNPIHGLRAMPHDTFLSGDAGFPSFESFPSDAMLINQEIHSPQISYNVSNLVHGLIIADLDPDSAKLAIGILGPFLSAFGFLFILRIVMSWYPKLPVGKFPYVIAFAPTEPLLGPTRKLIPPLGGVDVTPVVWFGLISFLNEILVGPQGLLVLLFQQVK